MIAYQKIVRDEMLIKDSNNLFGNWWDNIDKDLTKAVIKQVDREVAKSIIEQYEYLHCLSAVNWFYYGIFFDNICGGVVVFGPEYSENLGVWDKYGYTGKMILLSRGVCVHWTPINTASKLITQAIKLLPDKYKVITCTIDPLAGEIGTIYQACNFIYVGSMRENNPNIKNGKSQRDGWIINGKLYGNRSLRSKLGSQRAEVILNKYPDAIYMKQLSKRRYFYFKGTVKEKKELLNNIKHLIKPYDKR